LFPDENERSRSRVVVVLQKIMHAQPEILEIELGHIVPIDRVRIKIVFLQIPAEAPPLFVFSPEKSGGQQNDRCNDRCDHINGDVAAFNHLFSGEFEKPILQPAAIRAGDEITLQFGSAEKCNFARGISKNKERRSLNRPPLRRRRSLARRQSAAATVCAM
jgi:hypothetical protein